MNLQKLRIINYKRLRAVELDFPSTGVIGVVGNNGAGKSTLFEAILWVLFGPRAGIGIAAATVTHRRLGGNTEVSLTVEEGDAVYTVVRKARASGSGPAAEIYRNDETEPFVRGVREVTRFVQESLLHMNADAFMTTFFARQKELGFFADANDAERRRQVQRLLDLDAVEMAHEALRDEMKGINTTATAAAMALQLSGGDRDLDWERATAQEAADAARAALAESNAALAAVQGQHTEAQAAHTTLLDVQRQHDGYGDERNRLAVTLAREQAHEDAARQTLATLAERDARGRALAPEVARLPVIQLALRDTREAHAHAQTVERATLALHSAVGTVATLGKSVDSLVADLAPLRDLLFTWDDVAEAAPGLARAHTLATTLIGTAPLLAGRLDEREKVQKMTRLVEEATHAATEAKSRTNAVAQIEARLNVARAGEDPQASVDALTRDERSLTEQAATQDGEYKALRAEHKRYSDLLKRWQGAEPDEPCPTCGRPFSPDDAGIILDALRRSIEDCTERGKAISAAIKETTDTAREVRGRLQTEQGRLDEVRQLTAQQAQAERQETEAKEKAQTARRTLLDALTQAGRKTPPATAEIADLDAEILLLQRAANAAAQAMGFARQINEAEVAVAERREALAALGPATYDADAHAALHRDHTHLIAVKTEAEGIARELATRPEIERRRDAALAAIASADTETAALDQAQAALGFDPVALAAAAARVATLVAERDDLNGRRTEARIALRDAETALAGIEAQQTHLAALRAEAVRHEATKERYARMDKGFTDFSRDLAARIRPKLSDYASELVERMTNGRYVRMLFNDDYAPALYDDEDAYFPIVGYSGGERDVATLAARIALSQLLAARGGHAVGFMVLDEVFGSLDGERRVLVLDALASMREIIPQLFVISHVDDVRLSPVMDEVWTVSAQPDGTSIVLRRGLADMVLTERIASVA